MSASAREETRFEEGRPAPVDAALKSPRHYRRLYAYSVALTLSVSLIPLVVMTILYHRQYASAMRRDCAGAISGLTATGKRSIEDFIEEHLSALAFTVNQRTYPDLCDQERLALTLTHMKASFGGFVDLGVLDADGTQRFYVGPYALRDKHYGDQDWFREARVKGEHVSQVFLGYRNFPHFVIAVKKDLNGEGDFFVLRATVNTDALDHYLTSLNLRPSSEAFLVNRQGILQTQTRFSGALLERCRIPVPPPTTYTNVIETKDEKGGDLIVGYAYLRRSPYILMVVERPSEVLSSPLAARNNILWLLGCSTLLIAVVVAGGCHYLVNRIRRSDHRWVEAFQHLQHTNKMSSIGRLAAGVAHEINNPMAIINENAGLLKDLASLNKDLPEGARFLKIADTIQNSVARCGTIAHRLLGFAKRMEPQLSPIDLAELIREVLGFLGKESDYRNIQVSVQVPADIPPVRSDRGQLQQVFLNIITNAFAAVSDGGHIEITLHRPDEHHVAVTVSDDGHGIPTENLEHIFEPFFTTKHERGVGLGLSICYGIVEKLGGHIGVHSEVGVGTRFTVTLPIGKP